jgi:D-arabinose 1-dehydrogenase-like Zn-dependent alcohol dehydrogenase
VTAFTSTEAKREEALAMGAHHTLDSRDPKALRAAAGKFDLILSTVNVKLNWAGYLNTLRKKGRLHFLGATLEPAQISVMQLMGGNSAFPHQRSAVLRLLQRCSTLQHDIISNPKPSTLHLKM